MSRQALPPSRYADIGGPVHYLEWDGPPGRTFVLVHGLGGSHLQWIPVGPLLARHGRVLAVDLAGFGRTPRAGRSAKLTANRALLSRFLEEVVGGPAILAGNSMGGGIAVMQAAVEPASVEGLILSSSVYPWAPGGMPSPMVIGGFALYRTRIGEWAARQRVHAGNADRIVRLGFRINTVHPERIAEDLVAAHVDLLAEQSGDPDFAVAFLEAARSLLRLGQNPERGRLLLDDVKCPVIAIHGRRDRLVPASLAWTATESHPSWWVRVLPDVGHIPQMEAPDRWMAAVEEWLGSLA
ncbi:MAG: alpha/beta fold hydrolase [Actinomycetota bacterium]